ncbi:MAG: hypothetical protein HC840_10470 [Leptolyngbyaceae cyanobacterium RM2_2_4]|nr:hypothetical protein [Leptolyngbyaceae cyanobacterium RM2_2_4]
MLHEDMLPVFANTTDDIMPERLTRQLFLMMFKMFRLNYQDLQPKDMLPRPAKSLFLEYSRKRMDKKLIDHIGLSPGDLGIKE